MGKYFDLLSIYKDLPSRLILLLVTVLACMDVWHSHSIGREGLCNVYFESFPHLSLYFPIFQKKGDLKMPSESTCKSCQHSVLTDSFLGGYKYLCSYIYYMYRYIYDMLIG